LTSETCRSKYSDAGKMPSRHPQPVTLELVRHRRLAGEPILSSSVHYADPHLHYEVSRPLNVPGLELGVHCETRDKDLNRYLLFGFRKNLFEIKDTLGESIEAEMWDKGWTKIYEVFPEADYSADYQVEVGARLAEIIVCLHPFYVQLRNDVARVYR